MGVTTNLINKPFNPRAQDQSPLAYNRAALYSGKALDFDGVNDSVTATGSNTLSFSSITLSAYFKFDNLGATQVIFAKRKDVAGYWSAAFIMSSSGELDFRTTTGTTEYKAVYSDFVTGEYYHVVGINDGSNNYLYVNGQLVDTTASGAIDNTTTYDFVLGNNATGQYYYNGQLSNVKVYSTALTAEQVADLYNNPEKVVPTGLESNLKLWLPMMEGAGTTAYDGSGNGNHGTISGATYVNGIGAPVAQSAVMDWNKGVNETAYSEEFNSWTTKDFGVVIVDNDATAPDGQETAATITFAANQVSTRVQDFLAGSFGSENQIVSVWARVTSGTEKFRFKCSHGGVIDYFSNDLTATTEWQRFSFSQTFGSNAGTGVFYGLYNGTDLVSRTLEFWGFQLQTDASALTPYVRTGATAQTSEVLLPQGLTTGRDITGVNLFENVRKQGALNLDGNSWAEVHDNESLDFGTGSFTLEAWVKNEYINTLSSYNVILNLGNTLGVSAGLTSGSGYIAFFYGPLASNYSASNDGSWVHIVGTYDGTNATIYANGVQESQAARTAIDVSTNEVKYIGKDSNISRTYKDQIAQPRIYNRALTAEEVQRNYNAGKNTYTN